jgi:copper transport outer membrane protein MctB
MFDFRYHLVSLAAVFIALAVGILVGAAISGKLGDAESAFSRDRIDALSNQLNLERAKTQSVENRGAAASQLVEAAYPALMNGRLSGKSFAVIFVGPVKGELRSAIERTLTDAGAGSPVRLIAVDTPVDPTTLDSALKGQSELAHFAQSGGDFSALGETLGAELIQGAGTPSWSALSSELVQERTGSTSAAVDGAIVIRSWTPASDGSAQQKAQTQATESLLEGVLSGLDKTGLPVIGVETSTTSESAIDLYRRQGIASVDDVDTAAGRLALAILLAGGLDGHYGLKDSASDGIVPPIEAVTATTTSG